ncbi:hypothetical protein LCL61_20475 [Amycolatopsis coloradensis]|uniref:Uncharacterized protein n=1 Tax=Amycolatopsis coloradensis TaxID=76021 RepID=A0ACD5BF73_9PSEU
MDISITAIENVVLEIQQLTKLFRGQRSTFGGIEVAAGEPALADQVT